MSEHLKHYLNTWDLDDPQLLAETATSQVYTVTAGEARVVLKLLTPIGQEEQKGAVALRHFNGHGAVRLLRADDQAHLLEYAEGENLIPLVERGDDEQATVIIADVLNQLHSVPAEWLPAGLTPLRRWFRVLFKKAEEDRRNAVPSIFVRAAPIAEALLANPQDVRVLHGDIHHENIRHHSQRGWLAFDPKGLIGERTFDAANTLCNPMNMPTLVENETRLLKIAGILAHHLGIDLARLLTFAFVYTCLSASWLLFDQQDASHTLRIAEILEPHVRR